MNDMTLRPIDADNFHDCFALELAPGQEEYVSCPMRSLAVAYVYRAQCTPLGVYLGDAMVGYLLVLYDYDETTYNLWHVMIDRRHQGRGYGRRAVTLALEYMAGRPLGDADVVLITCAPENAAAWHLYRSIGFAETGRADDGEVELALRLPPVSPAFTVPPQSRRS